MESAGGIGFTAKTQSRKDRTDAERDFDSVAPWGSVGSVMRLRATSF